MNFRNLDLDSITSRLNSFTMHVNDYQMISPTVARVMINYTGTAPNEQEEIRASIGRVFKGMASPVAESFRKVTEGVIAGFVKVSREVREYDEATVTAAVASGKMKVMAANLLMDKTDESLWEVKEGATGKYTVRQGNDDLSQLVHLATKTRIGTPTFAHLASVPAEQKEFAAFVSKDSEEVEHGYVVASADGVMSVLPVGADEPVNIEVSQLVEVLNMDGDDTKALGVEMAAGVAGDKAAVVEYYKKAYGYAPDYLQKIMDMINCHSFA
jgi:hypothetical protein